MLTKLLAKEANACAFRSGRWFASLTFGAIIALQAGTGSAAVAPVTVHGSTVTSATLERSNDAGVTARVPVVVAQAATPAATDAPAAPVNASQDNGGIPGWVWLLLAIVVIGIVLWLRSRRKATGPTARGGDEPIIKTRK